MNDQSPYRRLGVSEDASFEEIREVRDRLIEQLEGDEKQVASIEAAYDAILMDRLRLRQEGKIKVPDRIRYPERLVQPPPSVVTAPAPRGPAWFQQLVDTPPPKEIGVSFAVFAGLGLWGILDPLRVTFALALGVLASLYFLNRKERKLGRAVLLTLGALVGGVLLAGFVAGLLSPGINQLVFSGLTFLVLWLIACFLR
ncbi:CPP1-like family protein [Leptolyngbya sp. FACHB-261]|uniref:CPP1-like family protein n=1 Tax=Leptolyngbya sp. FACHB-261 TaxID=2692806 RepID=UPI001687345D|nr:CPP1-like family protein [Leptolyngbya sp. FACHB-261]MBD2105009.1 CPP1-like family protein [Leptolyngbya sp. FACHB-261]